MASNPPADPTTPLRPRRRRGALRGFQALVDRFVPMDSPEDRFDRVLRGRILVTGTFALALLTLLSLPIALFGPTPGRTLSLTGASLPVYLSIPLILRWTRSLPLATSIGGGWVLLILTLSSLHASSTAYVASIWFPVVPLAVTVVAGWRVGAAFCGVALATLAGLYALHTTGYTPVDPSSPSLTPTASFVGPAMGILLVGLFSFLFDRSHRSVTGEIRRVLARLQASESRLTTLFENTNDVICALDTNFRVTALNTPFKRFFTKVYGLRPDMGTHFLDLVSPARRHAWERRLHRVMGGERCDVTELYETDDQRCYLETTLTPIMVEGRCIGVTIFGRDITPRMESDQKLQEAHRRLVDLSRQAGMAEMATGLLHDVGNVLNSVNVSSSVVQDRLQKLRVDRVRQAAKLLAEHDDPRSHRISEYLDHLGDYLDKARQQVLGDVDTLVRDVGYIKTIITTQQQFAKKSGVLEHLSPNEVACNAIDFYRSTFGRAGIQILESYDTSLPETSIDRHKVLQILLNLLSNSRQALQEAEPSDPVIEVRTARGHDGTFKIVIYDNGIGIPEENLSRVFEHGFTTKPNGHGFGLHGSANAAHEMSGSLTCTSAGSGRGACFTLELPLNEPNSPPFPRKRNVLDSIYG